MASAANRGRFRMAMTSLLLLLSMTSLAMAGSSTRKFLHVSDFHLDPIYQKGSSVKNFCHLTKNSAKSDDVTLSSGDRDKGGDIAGTYGNLACDSPKILVKSAIKYMKKVLPDPDFILWTGDSSPHYEDGWDKVYSNLRFITKHIYTEFNGSKTTVIPCLGNHDSSPKDNFPDFLVGSKDANERYSAYLTKGGFGDLISSQSADTDFRKCGYYVIRDKQMYANATQTFIVLNTNLYYENSAEVSDGGDPCDQLAWLESQLTQSADDERVFIVAHVPPGFFDLVPNRGFFASDAITKRYLQIVGKKENAKKIVAHFYGHAHVSTFRLFFDPEDQGGDRKAVGVGFLAPSVTPLMYAGGVNPSFRVYEYDPQSRRVVTFTQYYLPLEDVLEESKDDSNSGEGKQKLLVDRAYGLDNEMNVKSAPTTTADEGWASADRSADRTADGSSDDNRPKSRRRNNGKLLKFDKRQAADEQANDKLVSTKGFLRIPDSVTTRLGSKDNKPELDSKEEEETTTIGSNETTTELSSDKVVESTTAKTTNGESDDQSDSLSGDKGDSKSDSKSDNKNDKVTTTTDSPLDTTTATIPIDIITETTIITDESVTVTSGDRSSDEDDTSTPVLSPDTDNVSGNGDVSDRIDDDDKDDDDDDKDDDDDDDDDDGDDQEDEKDDSAVVERVVDQGYWRRGFDAREDLMVSELTVRQMHKAWIDMKNDPEGKVFNYHWRDVTVLNDIGECDAKCHAQMICVITNYLNETFRDCMQEKGFSPPTLDHGAAVANTKFKFPATNIAPQDNPSTTTAAAPATSTASNSAVFRDPAIITPSGGGSGRRTSAHDDDEATVGAPSAGEEEEGGGVSSVAKGFGVAAVLILVSVVSGVSFWYYRRMRRNRYRSTEFLLSDSVFKYGYSQVDQP